MARVAAERGLEGDTFLSEEPGHLTELAREAAAGGAKLLVAVGGDGTVNEVVNGIAGLDGVELAVVHRGTGGDFVRTFGIPHSLDGALEVARDGATREIDLGRATFHTWAGPEGEAWFANAAERRHERRRRQARQRDGQGPRRQGVVRVEHVRRLRPLAKRADHRHRRRRAAERERCTT